MGTRTGWNVPALPFACWPGTPCSVVRASAVALAHVEYTLFQYFNLNTSPLQHATSNDHGPSSRTPLIAAVHTSGIPLKHAVSSPVPLLLFRISSPPPSGPFRRGKRSHDFVALGAVGLQPSGDDAGVPVAGEGIDRETTVVSVAAVRWWRWPERLVVNGACLWDFWRARGTSRSLRCCTSYVHRLSAKVLAATRCTGPLQSWDISIA